MEIIKTEDGYKGQRFRKIFLIWHNIDPSVVLHHGETSNHQIFSITSYAYPTLKMKYEIGFSQNGLKPPNVIFIK